ncbi:MAG: integrase/recombinase XerD [Actinomycetota bacterium]|nr:integrase/recombinase XerD [Actinomycetota bacterium]MDQ1496903.1 integrase/recombinase XerD [Actinomycetota bacterium]
MPGSRTIAQPSVLELAEDWLAAKRALESAAQAEKGNSDRARRADLGRWALILTGNGRPDELEDPEAALAELRLSDLHFEALIGAVGAAKARWSDATVARMLSTLRGFTRWLTRTGHLSADPLDDDLLRAPPRPQRRPKALSAEDVDRFLATAAQPAPPRQRIWWPTRDFALVRFLATTGARAEETCAVRIGDIDRRAERPIWRVNTAKGDKTRDVPLPRLAVTALDTWLAERSEPGPKRSALVARRADPLFVRPNGTPLSEQALDRIIRGLAQRAGVVLPAGAAAHAFRHHYGVTLALRGVPTAVISQLMGHADPRTTAIYTTVAATQLIAALDDAGLL